MRLLSRGLLLFLCLVTTGCLESSRAAPAELASKYGDTAVLYSASWCGYCKSMRSMLVRENIAFIEYDIETSRTGKSEFDKIEGRGIPTVLFKGRVVDGYAPKAVIKLAEKN